MRIARVSLGAAARGMTQRDEVALPQSADADGGVDGRPTGRVYLRTPVHSDRAEFTSLMRASRAVHRPWATAPTDDEAFDAYVLDSRRTDFEAMLVCRRADRAILGFFNLSHITRGSLQSAYLGYAVASEFAHQGYMREGLALVVREAFVTLGLHRIEANIQPGNKASIALARGAGFRREGFSPRYLKIGGRWRDHERWAILVEEWRDRPASRRLLEAAS
jgi:[ribosomal protein S5]-alanine N-acetyltransferase